MSFVDIAAVLVMEKGSLYRPADKSGLLDILQALRFGQAESCARCEL